MDASAVPHFRNGGPSAAAQTIGARGRQSRGGAATMVDVDDDGEEIFDLPFTAMLGKPALR
nr:hypothetical protein [Bradyrhizobium symbiodeficiens]